jgi:hypothetical protein
MFDTGSFVAKEGRQEGRKAGRQQIKLKYKD